MLSPNTTITAESSPIPTIPPSFSSPVPANFTMLDLELLHFWTTQSVQQFVDFQNYIELFQITVVNLAFDHSFLMHELLALAALHLSHLRPHKASLYLQASDNHAAAGLAQYQPEIANLTPENCHACYAFSTTLFVHAWAAQDPNKPSTLFFTPKAISSEDKDAVNIQWVKLHRGSSTLLESIYGLLVFGPLESLFSPWRGLDPNRYDPLLEGEKEPLTELANAWCESTSLSAAHKQTLDETHGKLKRIFSMMTYNLNISKLNVVMAWLPMIPEEFLIMVEQKIPEALLIVIYFCVALKRLDQMWWMKGKAENLLNTMNDELGSGWERWTKWPMEQVLGGGVIYGQMVAIN